VGEVVGISEPFAVWGRPKKMMQDCVQILCRLFGGRANSQESRTLQPAPDSHAR
jgi:hypothetical protein